MDAELRDRWLEQVKTRLSTPGRHAGAARAAVLEVLANDGQCLLEANDVIDRLRARRMGSAASVYRILQELLDLGLLNRFDGRDGIARYEIADPGHRHHHFIDQDSGAILPFHDELLDEAVHQAAQRLGIDIASHEIVLRGVRKEGNEQAFAPDLTPRVPQRVHTPNPRTRTI